jgi:hypothetical protein
VRQQKCSRNCSHVTCVLEGVYIQQGRKITPEHHPRGKGGGGKGCLLVFTCVFVVEGVYIQQGRKRTSEHRPRGKGGGLMTEAIRIAFVVHAVEAVGATHGILAVQVVEGVARRRTRCGSCCRAACNALTRESLERGAVDAGQLSLYCVHPQDQSPGSRLAPCIARVHPSVAP